MLVGAMRLGWVSLRELAEISGHRSLTTLERYLDLDAAREEAESAPS